MYTAHAVSYLDNIHVRQSESRLLQSASNGVGRANAHYGRVASHPMHRDNTRKGRQIVLREGRFSCEQEAGTAKNMYDEECNVGQRQQRKREKGVSKHSYSNGRTHHNNQNQMWCVNKGEYMVFGSMVGSAFYGIAPVLSPSGLERGLRGAREEGNGHNSIGHTMQPELPG